MAGAAFEVPKDNRSEASSEEESDDEAGAAGVMVVVPPPDQDGHADSAEEQEGERAEEGGVKVKGVEGGSPAEAPQGQEKVAPPPLLAAANCPSASSDQEGRHTGS